MGQGGGELCFLGVFLSPDGAGAIVDLFALGEGGPGCPLLQGEFTGT